MEGPTRALESLVVEQYEVLIKFDRILQDFYREVNHAMERAEDSMYQLLSKYPEFVRQFEEETEG